PTSLEPVKATNLVFGCSTSPAPKLEPDPGQKFTTPSGIPASCSASKNLNAIAGESCEGFTTTVLPQTIAAMVIPAMMAQGKFHGGITAPTPSGIYCSVSFSPGSCTGVSDLARRSASRA